MRAVNRIFAILLFVLVVFAGLNLVSSARVREFLLVRNAIFDAGRPRPLHSEIWRARAAQAASDWDNSAPLVSLVLAGLLCGLGWDMRRRLARESARLQETEKTVGDEQQALAERTRERNREQNREAEERSRAENLNRAQKQILRMLADPNPQSAEAILRHLAATLTFQQPSWTCAVHLIDPSSKTLELAAGSDVDEELRGYLLRCGTDFPDAPAGQACCSGNTFVVESMTAVQRPWSELPAARGIFSAWSAPVHNKDSVAGTLTVYCRQHSGPSARDLELTEAAAGLAALVVEHCRLHEELARNAYYDVLTGVPNRRGGTLALEHALEKCVQRRQEPLSLFWIDLNHFKRINDQHGHGVGDEVLGALARRLSSHPLVKGNLARVGGDEFLVLVQGGSAAENAKGVCQQLLEAIGAPVATSAGVVSVGATIGVCSYPRGGVSSQILERNADFARSRAKSNGESFCIFSPAMEEEVSVSLELEEALKDALEHNELRVVYQPIYSCAGGLSGFEALARFRNAKLGEVSPARFIPKAEETGLIVPIGEWVLRQACREINLWMASGFAPVRMSVNVSAVQIARDDFAETVAGIVNESGAPPELLTLELTETAVMDNPEAAARQMFLLKAFGIRLALDDFGTGYSSLSALHKLPIDVVKIDKSFTDRLTETGGTRSIVEAIIAMARHLGLYVVAEGVETVDQQHILEQAGCDALQGFLFARPLPPEEAQGRMAALRDVQGSNRAVSA